MNSWIKFAFILIFCFSIVYIQASVAFELIETYTVADGLAGPIVPVIFQDSRGTLWFGSDSGGVSRFDGNTFVPYLASLGASQEVPGYGVQAGALLGETRQIVEDKWGHIWFLTRLPSEDEGRVSRFDGTSIGLVGNGNSLIVDRQGDVWVGENQRLTKYVAPDRQRPPQAHPNEIVGEDLLRSTDLTINVIFQSEDGTLWLGGSEGENEQTGVILSFRESRRVGITDSVEGGTETRTPRIQTRIGFARYDTSNLNVGSAIRVIAEDASGNLLFRGSNLLLKFDGETFEQILPLRLGQSETQRDTSLRQVSIQRDTKGRLWFNDGRITRWWDGSQLQTSGNIQGVFEFEDVWGNLWFTNETGEVDQYDGATLALIPYSADGGLGIDRIRTVFEAINGDLWFGHESGATVFNPQPAIQNHGIGIGGSGVRGKSRFALWKDIIKIFEVEGDIWFVDKPVFEGDATQYTFFRYRDEHFDQVSIFIKPKTRYHRIRAERDPNLFVTDGEHRWLAFGGHIFKADATGLLWFTDRFQRIPFQTDFEIDHAPSPINGFHTDVNGRLWVLFESGKVQSYPETMDPSTAVDIEPETLPHLIKVTKMLEVSSGAKWFYNAVTGKLIRWNVSNPNRPIVLEGNTATAPLAVWRHVEERNAEASFLFPDVLKRYYDHRLVITKNVELPPVRAFFDFPREHSLACNISWRCSLRWEGTYKLYNEKYISDFQKRGISCRQCTRCNRR